MVAFRRVQFAPIPISPVDSASYGLILCASSIDSGLYLFCFR